MRSSVQQTIIDFFETYPVRQFSKSHIFIQPHEPLHHIYYLESGLINQYDIASNGNEIIVNVFKPGSFLPMSAIINKSSNRYFFEAATMVTVRIAPAANGLEFLQDNPQVVFDLLRRVYRGTDGLLQRMTHLMGGNAKSRLLFELVTCAQRFSHPAPQNKRLLELTENDLAKLSGLSRETVSRTIQQLKKDGLVEKNPGGIVIADLQKMQEMIDYEL